MVYFFSHAVSIFHTGYLLAAGHSGPGASRLSLNAHGAKETTYSPLDEHFSYLVQVTFNNRYRTGEGN